MGRGNRLGTPVAVRNSQRQASKLLITEDDPSEAAEARVHHWLPVTTQSTQISVALHLDGVDVVVGDEDAIGMRLRRLRGPELVALHTVLRDALVVSNRLPVKTFLYDAVAGHDVTIAPTAGIYHLSLSSRLTKPGTDEMIDKGLHQKWQVERGVLQGVLDDIQTLRDVWQQTQETDRMYRSIIGEWEQYPESMGLSPAVAQPQQATSLRQSLLGRRSNTD